MSGYLAGIVWHSGLDSNLKPLAACLADLAGHDGDGVHPSNEYLQWLLGWGESTVRAGMGQLRDLGVLVAVGNSKGGRGKFVLYRIDIAKLPTRPSWDEVKYGFKRGQNLEGLSAKRGQKTTEKGPENEQRNKEETLEEPLDIKPSPLLAEVVPASDIKGPDERHIRFKDLIFRFYQWKWKRKPGWDGSDAAQLARLLKANPDLDDITFATWLRNYGESKDITPGERPRRFLPRIENYSVRPLNQFGRDGAGSANGKASPAEQRGQQISEQRRRLSARYTGATPTGDAEFIGPSDRDSETGDR